MVPCVVHCSAPVSALRSQHVNLVINSIVTPPIDLKIGFPMKKRYKLSILKICGIERRSDAYSN